MSTPSTSSANRYVIPFAVVTILFFMWGFITVLVDSLIPRLKMVFELTYFQAGLIQFAFFGAYFLVSIPGGRLISRIGYKRGVVAGLSLMAIGCMLFYPAASVRVYGLFLAALFVLASGMTILQVAANPYVVALGPASSASARLNLSQAFNSLGTTIAPFFGSLLLLGSVVLSAEQQAALTEAERMAYVAEEAAAVQTPFLLLAGALLLLAVFFALFKLPSILDTDSASGSTLRETFKHLPLRFGAFGIFAYVGAEVAIGSYLVNYFLTLDLPSLAIEHPGVRGLATFLAGDSPDQLEPTRVAGSFLGLYWGGAMVGRFLGSALMVWIRPGRLMGIYALVNVSLLILTATSGGLFAVFTALAIGLFNSIMFPTIFSLAIGDLGDATAQGSGILCTAIVGGAIIPPLYGALADTVGLSLAFLLPAVCYLYISWYGFYMAKNTA